MLKKRPNIIVALNLSFESHREVFFGISREARRLYWRLHFISFPELFTRANLSRIKADGIITTHHGSGDSVAFLMRSRLPLVIIGPREPALRGRAAPTAHVRFDDCQIGLTAGRFLCHSGRFRAAAFVADNRNSELAKTRLQGFKTAFQRAVRSIAVYNAVGREVGTKEDIESLADFLKHLAKPAAVMCIYDKRASDVFEASAAARIRIPEELSVISIDNDSLICDFTEPSLTSVAPDYQQLGETAAHTLEQLRSRRKIATEDRLLHADNIIDRGSTRYVQPSAYIADEAMVFIRKYATKGISAAEVAKHLRISRRLMDLRFRQGTGKSVLGAIIDERLKKLQDKLLNSNLSIGRISAECGFKSENHAKALFKKRFGVAMREWRRQHHFERSPK